MIRETVSLRDLSLFFNQKFLIRGWIVQKKTLAQDIEVKIVFKLFELQIIFSFN